MADGRRNNGGHSTKGRAGRKPKAQELKLAESMDKILNYPEVLEKLSVLVAQGDFNAIKLWLEYRLGKPQASVDLTSNGETMTTFTVNVVNSPDGR